MNRSILLLLVLLLQQAQAQTYSRVKIYANAQQQAELHQAGICLDHGKHKYDTWIETDLSEEEIQNVRRKGIKTEILIPDVQAHYQEQNATRSLKGLSYCGNAYDYFTTPVHFKYGSMGGYPTYAQVMSDLDSMHLLYPSLVTPKTAIMPYLTHNGNTVDWVKISDNASTDEAEPKMLVTALHHAREPASVHQLLYFMWYLLENYGTDPGVTWLVDHTEIYFVPVINPDGYLHNESTNPGGGGMWRKNRRNNGDGTYGVDLNRNYSYQWGVSGSSSVTGSDVYKGPSAFSEPETQAIRDFSVTHQFKIALNYHTYGNLLLHPYGYGYVPAPDAAYLSRIGALLVAESDLVSEQAVTLYPASGDSDDWMYGDTTAKPRIFAFTPEVGPDNLGFWPPMSQIEDICRSVMYQNITSVKLLHYFCRARETNEEVFRNGSLTQYFKYDLEKLGLADTGTATVSLVALSPAVTSTGPGKTYTDITGFTVLNDSISFTLDPAITPGSPLQFILECVSPTGVIRDTVTKYFGMPGAILSHDFSSLTGLTNSGFSVTSTTSVSPPSSLTDSPGGNYSSGTSKSITTGDVTIPSTAVFAQVRFRAKWAIEDGYDYAQFLISTDNGASFEPLCGKYTNKGTSDQQEGEPLYDASITDWVLEEINLNNYIGQTIRLRLTFVSDAGVNMDGFYMDDLVVEIINPAGLSEYQWVQQLQLWPNPAGDHLNVYNKAPTPVELEITDVCGKVVKTCVLQENSNVIDVTSLQDGYYLFRFTTKGHNEAVFKVSILR